MEHGTGTSTRGREHVYNALVKAGITVRVVFPGIQTLPVDRTIADRDETEYVMARHETAIPHAAWGNYESGGGITARLTVPGPGDTNAAHGLKSALNDGVPIVYISATSSANHRNSRKTLAFGGARRTGSGSRKVTAARAGGLERGRPSGRLSSGRSRRTSRP
ncbi:thiamine pyrophosphate-binding protein [Natrinema gelatinilyticum]|uniref:thiamine pyrophosphate-binding protein n=1 Tax=Natrinema gelatinilyticum TaxID=2961571 RepID=UPI0020C34986|nr:thiamine pyrophosphate-binding protein [Natrinema gelatinilyticum]